MGQADWYNVPDLLEAREATAIAAARTRLATSGKPETPGGVVAELTFGFWLTLFNRPYESRFLYKILRDVFPQTVAAVATTKKRLHPLRHLRNRVYHYEPIFSWSHLAHLNLEIQEVLDWLDPTWTCIVRSSDRYPDVYKQGIAHFLSQLP